MSVDRQPKLKEFLDSRLSQLRERRLDELRNEGFKSETIEIDGKRMKLSTYVEPLGNKNELVLVTLHVSVSKWFGLWGWHTEKGLIFDRDGNIRDATIDELISTGL